VLSEGERERGRQREGELGTRNDLMYRPWPFTSRMNITYRNYNIKQNMLLCNHIAKQNMTFCNYNIK